MTQWQWWTRTLPLNDRHDVMVRFRFRLLWCTGTYLVIVLGLVAFGDSKPVSPIPVATIFVVAIGGALYDLYRLARKPPSPPSL